MSTRSTLWVSLIAILLSLVVSAQAQDPGAPDTVSIESITVLPGESFGLRVNGVYDESLKSAELGIRWSSSSIRLDSATFVGGLLGEGTFDEDYLSLLDTSVALEALGLFVALPPNLLPPGRSTLLTYWFIL